MKQHRPNNTRSRLYSSISALVGGVACGVGSAICA